MECLNDFLVWICFLFNYNSLCIKVIFFKVIYICVGVIVIYIRINIVYVSGIVLYLLLGIFIDGF